MSAERRMPQGLRRFFHAPGRVACTGAAGLDVALVPGFCGKLKLVKLLNTELNIGYITEIQN